MLVKYLEMTCDAGGCSAEHFANCSRADAEDMARDGGWLVVNGKHFCSEACLARYREARRAKKGCADTTQGMQA